MLKPNKALCSLVSAVFFLNIVVTDASACWWKGSMFGYGSPTISGAASKKQSYNTGSNKNQITAADPVYLHNGDFAYEFKDFSIPSRSFPLEIKHSYKSQSVNNNRFGYGWDLNCSQRVVPLSNGDAYYFDGANMRQRFSYLDGVNYVSPQQIYDKLKQNPDGTWTLSKKHGEEYFFNPNGLLTKITDRNGNAMTFTYNPSGKLPIFGLPSFPRILVVVKRAIAFDWQLTKITDSAGRDTSLAYNADGKLTSITDFSGRIVKYTYDTNGDLLTITKSATTDFPAGNTTTFTYANHKLTSITDAKGQKYLTNHYNGQEMVDSQEYGTGTVYMTYDTDAYKTEVKDGKGHRTVYYFNDGDNGNPVKKEEYTSGLRSGEPASYITTYTYNNHQELTGVSYPEGNSVLYSYDNMGNLLEIRRKALSGSSEQDIVSTFTYTAIFNFIKTKTDPKNNITTYYYDFDEAISGDLNGDGVTNESKGNLVKISYPVVNEQTPEVKFTYNAYGQVITVVDPNGSVTKYEYDPTTGYSIKITKAFGSPQAAVTEMTYDPVGNVKTLKDPKGNTTTFEYDSHNNLTKTISPAPFDYITKYKYDANDNLIQLDKETRDAVTPWQTTYYTYDILDRLETTKDDLDNITTIGYDANGNRNFVTDAESNSTNYTFDERNLLWKVTDSLNNTTEYDYDDNGNLAHIKDSKTNITSYSYDGFDRLNQTTYPDSTNENYSYDANSNMTEKSTRNNSTMSYAYDALNRVTQKTTPETTTDYVYDAGSRMTSVTDPNGSISYIYDALSRVKTVSYPQSKSISYDYDSNGNRTKLVYPDSSLITYVYDNLNRLTDIKDASNQAIVHYSYDALSRRSGKALLNGTYTTYTYDAINRLTELKGLSPQGTVPIFTYTYDNVSNRKTMTTQGGTHSYTYDNIYQLKTVDYPATSTFPDTAFNYDSTGNRTSTVASATTNYTPNILNQYSKIGAANLTYDPNGNLTNIATNTYSYDSENRLITATTPTHNASYAYDPFGRRISKTVDGVTAKFLYDGDQIIAEYDGSNNLTAKYVYGAGIDEIIEKIGTVPGGGLSHFFYHYDGLGSITTLTDSTGAIIESYSYDVFGKPSAVSTVGNRYMFTGREYDAETGLYYYRARMYSPELGRFLQKDPIGYAGGINLYAYCKNNSTNFIDPYGLRVSVGERNVAGVGSHTVIILNPDNQSEFANSTAGFYRNSKGELETTRSANPNWKPIGGSIFGSLTATPNISGDRPENMRNIQTISDPLNRSDTQLINDILNSANKYKNNLPYDPTPWLFDSFYNSNSYTYGVLKDAGISGPNLPGWQPGADKPIYLKKK